MYHRYNLEIRLINLDETAIATQNSHTLNSKTIMITISKNSVKKIQKNAVESFCPTSRTDWRKWLQKNHQSMQSVWLVCHKKKSTLPTISWSDLVDEALCFGWIDSIRKTLDEEKFIQFFSKRKPHGTWSKVNKEKINENFILTDNDLINNQFVLLQSGKKNYFVIRVV